MTQNHGAAMTALTTGDVVRLKSGGPAMTVESVDSDQRGGPGLEAACLWISESGCFGRLRITVGLLDVISKTPSVAGMTDKQALELVERARALIADRWKVEDGLPPIHVALAGWYEALDALEAMIGDNPQNAQHRPSYYVHRAPVDLEVPVDLEALTAASACGKPENEIVESAKRAAGAVNHTLHDTACRVAHAFVASPLTSADACLRCGRPRADHTT
jgi:uncharacterized protein YodC (DUF2158 family)